MRNTKRTKVFISAEKPGACTPAENARRTSDLACDLTLEQGIERFVQVAFGTWYESGSEREIRYCAWLRPGSIVEGIDSLRELAKEYEQDSILVVHGDDAAELVECNTEHSAIIGRFQALELGDGPESGEDYTFAGGRFYVVR